MSALSRRISALAAKIAPATTQENFVHRLREQARAQNVEWMPSFNWTEEAFWLAEHVEASHYDWAFRTWWFAEPRDALVFKLRFG